MNNAVCNIRFTKKDSMQATPNPQYWNTNTYKPGPERFKNIQSNAGNSPWNSNSISNSLMPALPSPPPISKIPQSQTLAEKYEPVTNEVINEVVGVQSVSSEQPKLKQQYYQCTECNLFLANQSSLDSHLKGARHARKLKELEISNSAKFENKYVIEDGDNNYKCTLCNVLATSLIHMKSHIDGAKHKTKEKLQLEGSTEQSKNKQNITKRNADGVDGTTGQMIQSSDPAAVKKQKVDDKSSFFCSKCNISSNSQIQYDQHINSKKHFAIRTNQVTKRKNPGAAKIPLQASFVPSGTVLSYDAWDPSC